MRPNGVAAGHQGFVAIGNGSYWDRNFARGTSIGMIWFSPDGLKWQRAQDPRAVLGSNTSLLLRSVVATGDGYMAVGSSTDIALRRVETQVVLTSADGMTWHKAASIASRWSLAAGQLVANGAGWLLSGAEFACTVDGGDHVTFSLGAQQRLWSGNAAGSAWSAVPLEPKVIVSKEPAPTSAKQCPKPGTTEFLTEVSDRFTTTGSFVGVAGGRAVLVSGDGDQAAVSSDLQHWTVAALPGAQPTDAVQGSAAGVHSRLVVPDGDGIALLSYEAPRDVTGDHALPAGLAALGWQTTDGTAWTRLASASPFVGQGHPSASITDDGKVLLVSGEAPSAGSDRAAYSLGVSAAGQMRPWGSCTPAARAACSFVDTLALTGHDLDLSGIDLSGAQIGSTASLAGDNLTGADLRMAGLYAPMTGTDFSKANARGARFGGDLTGADFSDADLTGASVVGSFGASMFRTAALAGITIRADDSAALSKADFSDLDLTAASFGSNVLEPGNFTGANFDGANLTNARFMDVDLTGATFAHANMTGLYFLTGVICPNGKPPTAGVYGPAACGLR